MPQYRNDFIQIVSVVYQIISLGNKNTEISIFIFGPVISCY